MKKVFIHIDFLNRFTIICVKGFFFFIYLSVVVFNINASAQNVKSIASSFKFKTEYGGSLDSNLVIIKKEPKLNRKYDFEAQYPYYDTYDSIMPSSNIGFYINNIPLGLYLYAYTVNTNDIISLVNNGSCIDIGYYNVAPFKKGHIPNGYIVFWLSSSELLQFADLAQGIEFNTGSMIERNLKQFKSRLLYPDSDWTLINNNEYSYFEERILAEK